IRLVAEVEGDTKDPAKQHPVVIRARGPRYSAEIDLPAGATPRQMIVVATAKATAGDRRDFTLESSLQLSKEKDEEVATAVLPLSDFLDAARIKAFNDNTKPFAALLTEHHLTVDATV